MLLQRQQLGQGVHALHRSERAAVLQQGQALGDVAEDLRLEVRRTLEVLQRGLNDGRLSRARTEGLRCLGRGGSGRAYGKLGQDPRDVTEDLQGGIGF